MLDQMTMGDQLTVERHVARGPADDVAVAGEVTIECFGPDGALKWVERTKNLVTLVGDQYYAGRASLSSGLPALVTGFKLGTGTTAAAKSGTGAALVTYLTGSNKAFDSGYPTVAAGVATYRRTYAAGEATSATPIAEAVIVNDTIATDATSSAANTICRALFGTAQSKAAGDSWVVTWTHTLLGS